jgi:pimeloyl-ACP methyl ester carboxylesterase
MTDGLLLLHAFPLSHEMWAPQVEAFKDRLLVVAPDDPGFGGTPPAAAEGWMDAAADQAAAALRAAGVDRAVVVGLSMGGYVAFSFWRRHASMVAGLVLANTRSGADPDAAKETRAALAARLRAEGNGFLADSPPPLLSADAPDTLRERVQELIRRQPAEAIAGAALGMAARVDSTPDLAGITVPALVITSSGDTLIPPDATSPMAAQIPGASLVAIEGAGHLSNLEAPERFNEALAAFLAQAGVALK